MSPLQQYLLLSTTLLLSLVSAACYDRGGNLRESWVACRPDLPTGSCCSSNDFCMDNGLCLNAGGNQAYTQQGCTDKNWGAGCKGYCPIGSPSDGLYYMDYCWRGFDRPANSWCCGVQCCGNGTSTSEAGNIQIPVATEIFRPGSRSISAGGSVPSSSATSGSTSSAPTGPGSETATSSGLIDVRTMMLGLGLGLGIPLLLVIAAAGWMFMRMRRSEQQNPIASKQQKAFDERLGVHQQQQQQSWVPAELGQKDPVELPERYSQYAR
ncbi:hypothetical protein Micbo1qcDRAFT_235685 [Microdochium bolleyi]|uniref:Mid2 domain-containing protein n=1 Tax=Microdochium bolleyi TaxID=196109 RepID=A0A136IVE8_9PEZI|nr:hypothetical protein Micbo1qcDRAFT_235685 [Microdochium bolleyi]